MSTLKTHNLQSPDAASVNIALAPNAGMVVAGLSTYSNQINVGSNIKLGSAGIITASQIISTVGTFLSDVSVAGDLQVPDAIKHQGDVNTKIRFPSNDTISFETSGSERIRIDSNGGFQIATTSGNEKLNVHGAIRSSGSSANFNAGLEGALVDYDLVGNAARFGHVNGASGSAKPIVFLSGGSEKARITSDGKLVTNSASSIDCGVGGMHLYLGDGARNDYSTTADGLIIEKDGSTGISIDPGSSGSARIYFPNESNHSIASISHDNSNGELRIRGEDHIILSTNNNTERLRIYNDGRVAINQPTGTGVANTGKVHIKSSASNIGQIYLEQNNATDGFILNQDGPNGGHLKFIRNIGGTQTVNVLFRSDRGICFNGDTAAANALDDYEEGDHNTTVTMSGDTSFSYSSRTLAYTKIGRAVFVTGRINMTGAGGSTFRFTLPFTCGDGSFKYETSNEFQNIRFNDGYTFRIRSNTAYVDLQSDGSNTGIGAGNPHINVNIFYFTA
tara:strand:+ start:1976 stop:3490 length:1515 start_codon:yes stop_codon:yes gene_type:complete